MTTKRACGTADYTARQAPDDRSVRRRESVNRRRAARLRAVPRETIARPARGRRSTGLRHALGALGLLATLLLAILPAHANGLDPGPGARPALGVHAIVDEGEDGTMSALLSMSTHRSDVQELGSTAVPGTTGHASPAENAPPTIGWYRLASVEQAVSVELLRALHEVESNAAPDGCIANAEGSGAIGPFQFKPATFRQYGVDANHDGHRDMCSFADALFSAARYLRALGADDLDDPKTREALVRYGTDPDRVLALARSYRDRAVLAD